MKFPAFIVATLILIFSYLLFYRWDSSLNRGWNIGYFGEFNRTSNALASIPGITITQSWHNLDVTLEEFGFDLVVTNQPIRIFFNETDPIRSMSRQTAIAALQTRITKELALSQTNHLNTPSNNVAPSRP